MDLEVPISKQIEKHYIENKDSLVKRVRFRTGSIHSAEDVVQEAYYRALGSFINGTNIDFWLSRILSNTLKDWMQAERELGGMDDIEENEGEPIDDPSIPTHVKLEIKMAINELSPAHREVVELNLIHGFDLRHIAQITDLKYKNVALIMDRFKSGLKEKYMR